MEIFGKRMRKYLDFQGAILVPFGTPKPLHGVNPRQMMDEISWNKVRKNTYQKYDYKCAICGKTGIEQGFNHPVEAHEIWDYDFDNCIQYFEGLVALCPICHKVIHWEQNLMALNSGTLSQKEFNRQQELKTKKIKEVNGKLIGVKHIQSHPWHDGDWVSDFSKLKELYPDIYLKTCFDTKWNGFFGREGDYIYKPIKGPSDVLF